jgi:hypothetical protein
VKLTKQRLKELVKEELEKIQEIYEPTTMGGERVKADMVYFWSILEPCPGGEGACSDGEREYVIGEKGRPMVVAVAGPADRINWTTTRAQASSVFRKNYDLDTRDDNMKLLMHHARGGKNVRALAPRDYEFVAERWWKPHPGE